MGHSQYGMQAQEIRSVFFLLARESRIRFAFSKRGDAIVIRNFQANN